MPKPDALSVMHEVVRIFSVLPSVQQIACFGSIAGNRHDRWSDADLLVACDASDPEGWRAAAWLRDHKPVLFYRMFSDTPQPSGRYWFEEDSPFHKIDLSFYCMQSYTALYQQPQLRGVTITMCPLFAREYDVAADNLDTALPNPVEIGERETRIGTWIRRHVDGLKQFNRSRITQQEMMAKHQGLRTALTDITPETVMAGGRIGALGHQLIRMGEQTLPQTRHSENFSLQ